MIEGGTIRNAGDTVGIAISGSVGAWHHYLNLTGTGEYFLYSGSPGDRRFSVDYAGNAYFKGQIAAGTLMSQSLAALSPDMGDIRTGSIQDLSGEVGIAISAINPFWQRYINLYNEAYPFIKHDKFTLDHAGNAVFSGTLSAATGEFRGTVSAQAVVAASSFTSVHATFTGAVTIGPLASHIRLDSGAINVRDGSGNPIANLSRSGSDAIVSAPEGDMILFAEGDIKLPGGAISYDVNDSAGPGYRAVRVPNA